MLVQFQVVIVSPFSYMLEFSVLTEYLTAAQVQYSNVMPTHSRWYAIERISEGGNAIVSVHPSVRPPVSTLSSEPTVR